MYTKEQKEVFKRLKRYANIPIDGYVIVGCHLNGSHFITTASDYGWKSNATKLHNDNVMFFHKHNINFDTTNFWYIEVSRVLDQCNEYLRKHKS